MRAVVPLVVVVCVLCLAHGIMPLPTTMAMTHASEISDSTTTSSYQWAELQDSSSLASDASLWSTEAVTRDAAVAAPHALLWELATVHGVDVAAFLENPDEAAIYAGAHIPTMNNRDMETIDMVEMASEVETGTSTATPRKSTQASSTSSPASKSKASGSKKDKQSKSASKKRSSTADRLKDSMHASRFERFTKKHRRSYKSQAAAAKAFSRFKTNRARIVALNDRLPANRPPLFKSDGPMADMGSDKFRKTRTNARNPRGNTRGRNVRIAKRGDGRRLAKKRSGSSSRTSKTSKKPRFRQLKSRALDPTSGAGKAARYSGNAAKKSGKTGGDAGGNGQKSGKTGGDAGGNGQKSGKTGGDAGGNGQKSGKTGGDSGGDASKSGKIGGGASDGNGQNFDSTVAVVNPQRLLESLRKHSGLTATELSTEWSALKNANFQMTRTKLSNQMGDCGSCYAFAAVDTIVRLVNAMTNGDFSGSISPQQAIDCITGTEFTRGCNGGTPMDVLEYFFNKAAVRSSNYPVTGTSGTCRENLAEGRPPSYGWEMLVPPCRDTTGPCLGQVQFEFDVLKWLGARETTPIAYVDGSEWQQYSSGIFPESFCSSSVEKGDHIVQIVGFEWTETDGPAWIIQNTWPNWGETRGTMRSIIRLPFGVNACGLFNFIINAVDPTGGKYNLASSVIGDPTKERSMTDAQIAKRLKAEGNSYRIADNILGGQQKSVDDFFNMAGGKQQKTAKQGNAKDFNIPVQDFSFDQLYKAQEAAKARSASGPSGPR